MDARACSLRLNIVGAEVPGRSVTEPKQGAVSRQFFCFKNTDGTLRLMAGETTHSLPLGWEVSLLASGAILRIVCRGGSTELVEFGASVEWLEIGPMRS